MKKSQMITILENKIKNCIEDIRKLCKVNNTFYMLDKLDTLKGHKIFIDGYSALSLENALNLGIVDNENVSVVY